MNTRGLRNACGLLLGVVINLDLRTAGIPDPKVDRLIRQEVAFEILLTTIAGWFCLRSQPRRCLLSTAETTLV
jgi:hypothetical protein